MNLENVIIKTLRNEVKPAMGCTEPVAISLATVGGDYKQGLKVLETITQEDEKEALKLIEQGKVNVSVEDTDLKILIIAEVSSLNNKVEVIIQDNHDRVVSIKKNDVVVIENYGFDDASKSDSELIYNSTIQSLINSIESMDVNELSFLKEGIDMNLKIAEAGMMNSYGMGVGAGLLKSIEEGFLTDDIMTRAMVLTASASDARMSGVSLPVMSSNGSGNNGLTAILPIAAFGKEFDTEEEVLVKALAISHVINCYIKNRIGKLSALCGCSIAAATGATAAISWMMGCGQEAIEGAMKNMIADVSGTICDGAKLGCALKLSTAASVAVKYALLAKQNCIVPSKNGIIANTIEETIKNLEILSKEGMQLTDNVILNIMLEMK